MRPPWLRALAAGPALLAVACGEPASAPTPTPPRPSELAGLGWDMGPIDAAFVSSTVTTLYRIPIDGKPTDYGRTPTSGLSFTVFARLELELVDPANSPDPTTPGSHAGVDEKCDNAGSGITTIISQVHPGPAPAFHGRYAVFTWTHPDPAFSTPPGRYNCDHRLQGPHGHQGLIRITVNDAHYQCYEEYRGTHTGKSDDRVRLLEVARCASTSTRRRLHIPHLQCR